jgi:hypothetical protein
MYVHVHMHTHACTLDEQKVEDDTAELVNRIELWYDSLRSIDAILPEAKVTPPDFSVQQYIPMLACMFFFVICLVPLPSDRKYAHAQARL